MVRKGYVERQLEGLAQMLVRLAGLPDAGIEGTRRQLASACRELTGLDLDTLSSFADATLLSCFASGDRARRAANAAIASRLLEARARIDPARSAMLRSKALLLAAEGIRLEPSLRDGDFLEHFEALRGWVVAENRPAIVRGALACADEALGRFSAAESGWIDLEDDGDPEARENRIGLYLRLLELPNDSLIAGGLAREEILEMLHICEGTSA